MYMFTGKKPTIEGLIKQSKYEFDRQYMFWGEKDSGKGSEHFINGIDYLVEIRSIYRPLGADGRNLFNCNAGNKPIVVVHFLKVGNNSDS